MRPTPTLFVRGKPMPRRFPFNTKTAPRNLYKGTRTGSMGEHTKWGGYIVDFDKVRSYVVPDLKGFKLTPYVTEQVRPMSGGYGRDPKKQPLSGHYYLNKWKEENGQD